MNLSIPLREQAGGNGLGRALRICTVVLSLVIGGLALFHWATSSESKAFAFRQFDGVRQTAVSGGSSIATTEAQWQAMWRSLRGDVPPPPFDEARQTGVAIVLGERPSVDHTVSILSAGQRAGRVVVLFEERQPTRMAPTRAITVTPYTILLIDHAGADIVVEQRVRD